MRALTLANFPVGAPLAVVTGARLEVLDASGGAPVYVLEGGGERPLCYAEAAV